MADDKMLKPKSFRIDDETAEKIREISNSIGGNQQETLSKLIEAWEFQRGKAVLTEKKANIEQFERYVNALTRMYMGVLEDNENVFDTVRTEFEAQLKSKDTIIQDLQAQLTSSKQSRNDALTQVKSYQTENEALDNELQKLKNDYETKLNDMQSMLADKEKLNNTLSSSYDELKLKVTAMSAEHEEITSLRRDLVNAALERDGLKITITELKKTVERIKAEMQLALEKAVLETERKYQEQIQSLKEDKQAEVDKYQQKYFDLLEKKSSKTRQKVDM